MRLGFSSVSVATPGDELKVACPTVLGVDEVILVNLTWVGRPSPGSKPGLVWRLETGAGDRSAKLGKTGSLALVGGKRHRPGIEMPKANSSQSEGQDPGVAPDDPAINGLAGWRA